MKTTSGQDALTTPFDLPLKRGDYGDDIFDSRDKTVAILYGDERKPETAAQRDYIVRAVNSFGDMLDALKEYVEWGAMAGSDRDLFDRKFKAAIAKAERGQ